MGVLALGTVLGGCRIDEVVGRGGMGVVYRARQLDLDRDVALKVIAPELVEDPQTRRRFISEARAAGAVEHPNVVPVHGVGVAEGRAYLVMRYVAGDDLRALVRRSGPLAPARAATIAVQLGDALDAIHHAGYVHRDVKPQNVMVDAAGHVYLSDFGLAKHTIASAGPTRSQQWVGTLDYVAPEQIRGERVDARADVYALGGVLFFMLCGRVPFERDDDHAKLWAHLADAPPRPSGFRPELPSELDAVVLRALAKDPAERYPSAGDVGRAARSAAGASGDTAPERMVARGDAAPTTVAPRPQLPPAPRGRRRQAVAAAAVLLLVAAAAAFVLLSGSSRDGAPRGARGTPEARAGAPPTEQAATVRVGSELKHVGFRPRDLVVVDGRVWVISSSRDNITSIDVESGRPAPPHPLVGKGAASIARDGDAVWVASRGRRAVLRISARTGHVIRHITTAERPIRVAAGPSGLWVAERATPGGPATVVRYERDGSGQPTQWEFPTGIAAIEVGGGYLWVAPASTKRLMRIAPGAAEPEHGAWLAAPATALAYGAGRVWASLKEADSVARIDPRTQQAPTQPTGRQPGQLALAGGRVFVASTIDHTVAVLDAKRFKSVGKPLPVALNPYGVTAGAGHVWVTGITSNTLTRLDYGS